MIQSWWKEGSSTEYLYFFWQSLTLHRPACISGARNCSLSLCLPWNYSSFMSVNWKFAYIYVWWYANAIHRHTYFVLYILHTVLHTDAWTVITELNWLPEQLEFFVRPTIMNLRINKPNFKLGHHWIHPNSPRSMQCFPLPTLHPPTEFLLPNILFGHVRDIKSRPMEASVEEHLWL